MRFKADSVQTPAVTNGDAVARINRLADKFSRDPDEDAQLVGEWLRGGCKGNLLEHLGVENARGRSAWLEAARERRNAALRSAAALGGYDATALAAELKRYHSTCWPRDRQLAENPYKNGSVRALLWAALRAIDYAPKQRQMQRIIE